MRNFVLYSLLLMLMAGVFTACGNRADVNKVNNTEEETETVPEVKPEKAETLPAMQLRDQQGKTVMLSSLKGKRVFLNLWATWCPPCVAELPSIETLYKKTTNADQNAFLIVSLDDECSTAKKSMQC